MMLTLSDGRNELWQWDTGRTLDVDADCSQVHFSNKVFGRSIDVDVVDGTAIIPDILLQTDKELNVWAFVGTAENGYTKISKTFKVNRRNKPADYVFTAVEQTTIYEIAEIAQSVRDDADAGLFDGITPHIGANGNWYLGDTDTGKPSRGEMGEQGPQGEQGPKGDTGEQGPAGAGVPDGGTAGQLLSKTESGTEWIDPPQSGVQSDWNQNDDTQPDYVKNRPFYTDDPVETVFVEESTASFVENSGTYTADFPSTFEATFGKTYTVYWDGVAYECACVNFNNIPIIGNLSIMGVGSNTGEPFIMVVNNGVGIQIATADTSDSHTFSISEFAVEVVKIDEQYLPGSVFTEADWDFVSNRPLFYKQLNANITAENITQNIKAGNNYVALGVTTPDFNEGLYYKVEGEVSFFNNSANTAYTLQINGYYRANSFAEISFGTVYDEFRRKNLNVSFYGSNNPSGYAGKLRVVSSGTSQSYTITANFAIISELKQLSEDYIPNTIQRVGDDIILSSSTADSTKKFRITVDDSGTISATEVT